ncbi:hypothetical protein [Roseovarius sp.]|uniref:hypothetical protein n=1 Tax=Roseovarius sp. TaxID=1486281 RepID=UPI003B5B42CD
MRRAVPYLLCLLLLLAAAGMVRFGLGLAGDLADNRTIRDLHAGRTAEPRDAGDPRAHLAMALFLSWRGRIAEAEALGPFLQDAPNALRSDFHYAIGNARMREVYEYIATRRIDDAAPVVALAKAAYRDALRAEPGNYDAKVNLDLASRLVRDMPRPGAEKGDEDEKQPRQIWTDLPGLPRGAP